MKIFQINLFKLNNNYNKNEITGLNSFLPRYGVKLRPQIQQDTVSFTGKNKLPDIMIPRFDDMIAQTQNLTGRVRHIVELAKYGLNCPVCGHIMLDLGKYNNYEKKITSATNSTEMIAHMEELKKYLHPTEAKIFEIMKSENQKNPKKTLHDILKSYLPESEKRLVELQAQILAYIGILSRDLPEKECLDVQNLLKETFNRLIDARETSRFSRKIFISKLKNIFIPENERTELVIKLIGEFWGKYKNTKYGTINNMERYVKSRFVYEIENWDYTPEQEKILDESAYLPRARDNLDAFIVKYSKKDYKRDNPDRKIALRMYSNSLSTLEHIIPQSKGGLTVIENSAAECASCNNGRSSDSIITQIVENPTMPVNYRNYIMQLLGFAKAGLTKEKYIIAQNSTYRNESLGILDVEIPSSSKKKKAPIQKHNKHEMNITPTKAERRAAKKEKIEKIEKAKRKATRKKKIDNSKNVPKKNSDKKTRNRRFW